jgi:hypothetical protein
MPPDRKGGGEIKKTNAIIKVVGLLFFTALLTYLVVYIVQALDNPFAVEPAVVYAVRDSAELSGIIVRDEEVLRSLYNTVYISAPEGRMVSKGEVLASAYESEEALQKAVRISELETEIGRLEALLENGSAASDKLLRDVSISKSVLELKSAAYSREFADVEEKAVELRTLLFAGAGGAEEIQEQLDGLKAELDGISGAAGLKAARICAEASGLFSRAADGWEVLKPDAILGISASGLAGLLAESREVPDNALGKLVFGTGWYYAALIDREGCAKLKQGDRVSLLFGRYNAKTLEMTVETISRADEGRCAVVFSCDRFLTDVLNLRRQEAELVFSEYAGLRVPKKSVHVDEDGNTFVYVRTALRAEKKPVDIVCDMGSFYVVGSGAGGKGFAGADGAETGGGLRAGDQIIVSAKELYDGKVVG